MGWWRPRCVHLKWIRWIRVLSTGLTSLLAASLKLQPNESGHQKTHQKRHHKQPAAQRLLFRDAVLKISKTTWVMLFHMSEYQMWYSPMNKIFRCWSFFRRLYETSGFPSSFLWSLFGIHISGWKCHFQCPWMQADPLFLTSIWLARDFLFF